jgi:hypothetical protein
MSVPKVRNVLEYPDQHPVIGAKVTLTATDGSTYSGVTDSTGKWVLRVPGGQYVVTETVPEGLTYSHAVTVPKGWFGTSNLFDILRAV